MGHIVTNATLGAITDMAVERGIPFDKRTSASPSIKAVLASAMQIREQWGHLPADELYEQLYVHLESEFAPDDEWTEWMIETLATNMSNK